MNAFNIDNLKNKKAEDVPKAIRTIEYRLRTPGTYDGRITEEEAISDYNELIEALSTIMDLTEEEINTFTEQIKEKIALVPQDLPEPGLGVIRMHTPTEEEIQRDNAIRFSIRQRETERLRLYEEAKERYNKLSVFEKLVLNLKSKDPKSIKFENMRDEEIKKLYK